jgi:hypothetical protein
MDRAELERRIRQRRQEGPFHRGSDEHLGDPHAGFGAMGAFVPEAADELARHEQPTAEEQPRVDYFDERAARRAGDDHAWGAAPGGNAPMGAGGIPGAAVPLSRVDWPSRDLAEDEASEPAESGEAGPSHDAAVRPVGAGDEGAARDAPGSQPQESAPPPASERPVTEPPAPRPFPAVAPLPYEPPSPRYEARDDYQAGPPYGPGDDGGDGDDETSWTGYDDEPPRRGSGLAILGFLILGLAALLGGAVLFAAINAPKPAADLTSPSPTSTATQAGTESPTEAGTPTQGASPSPAAKDNFSAKVEPCASSRMGFSGCVDDGTHLSGDQVWVWVGFKNGLASTVLGVTIVSQATKSPVADGSLELDRLIGCDPGKTCSGYMQMSFGNLDPGGYQIQVTRDGDPAASTTFTVGS